MVKLCPDVNGRGHAVHTMQKRSGDESTKSTDLMSLASRAFLLGKDVAANLADVIENSSRLGLLATKQCEQELDGIEYAIDQNLAGAITRVGEAKARELLACLKFITDLERIGDLCLWVANRSFEVKLSEVERAELGEMIETVEEMLDQIHRAFAERNLDLAFSVLSSDRNLDDMRRKLFNTYLQRRQRKGRQETIDVLFMIQAIERCGDHVKNLAEEVVHLIEHRSIRHTKKRTAE
jgi:phosphate transport system protein